MIRSPLNGAAARGSSRQRHVISTRLRLGLFRGVVSKTHPRQEEVSGLNTRLNKDITDQDAPRRSHLTRPKSKESVIRWKPVYEQRTAAQALNFPTVEEVPDALKSCYKDGVLVDPGRIRNSPWVIRHVRARRYNEAGRGHTFCLRLSFHEGDSPEIEIIGKGNSKGAADYDANLKLVAKLHECGILQKVYDPLEAGESHAKKDGLIDISGFAGSETKQPLVESQDGHISASKISSENCEKLGIDINEFGKLAFAEVYNACAKIGCLPEVGITTESSISSPDSPAVYYTLSVELPRYNIFVSVKGTREDSRLQEQVAFTEFNRKMRERGLSGGSDPAQAQNSKPSLTLQNAEAFIRAIPDIDISVRRRREENYYYYQVRVNGETLGRGCSVSRERAGKMAFLATAISMANTYPKLLRLYLDWTNRTPLEPTTTAYSKQSAQDAHADIDRSWPIAVDLGATNLALLKDALARSGAMQPTIKPKMLEKYKSRPVKRVATGTLTSPQADARSRELSRYYRDYTARPDLEEVRRAKAKLPIRQYSHKILATVSRNPYTIIVGATGSGKTTQVPQIILDSFITSGTGGQCSVLCTQPRVMATTSVARRVAAERAQELGDEVGYQVRLDSVDTKAGGTISYCTTGILLRQLLYRPEAVFDRLTHLIIDEVHVRDSLIDLTLAVLKHAIQKRIAASKKVPQVILMSATMQSSIFAKYFEMNHPTRGLLECPIINVPGRAFHVQQLYLEEILSRMEHAHGSVALGEIYQETTTRRYLAAENRLGYMQLPVALTEWGDLEPCDVEITRQDSQQVPLALVAATVAHIAATTKTGAILIFLPGIEMLAKVRGLLEGKKIFGVDFLNKSNFRFYTLHSSLMKDQKEVFDSVPGRCRKIILSTDIAEASITIPEVQHVVDAGKHREFAYAQDSELETLDHNWISQSSSKQRAGRAGRVQNGTYYALFPKRRPLSPSGAPELLRADLQGACLAIRGYGIQDEMSIGEFLATTVTPPDNAQVQIAISKLTNLGVLANGEHITPLGQLLTALPVPPRFGKLIILGIIYKCLDPMLILASSSQQHTFFISSVSHRMATNKKRRGFGSQSSSDHIGLINAFCQARACLVSEGPLSMIDFAEKSLINTTAFATIAAIAMQIEQILEKNWLIPPNDANREAQYGPPSLNENSGKESLIKALISSCLDIAVRKTPNLYRARPWTDTIVHPTSTNETVSQPKSQRSLWGARQRLLAYTSLAQTGNTPEKSAFLRETTVVPPLTAALFANTLGRQQPFGTGNIVMVDGWIPIHMTGTERAAHGPGEAAPSSASEPEPKTPSAVQLVKLHSALRKMEADAYEVLNAKLSFSEARDVELMSEVEIAERRTQSVRDVLVRGVVTLLERDELVVEMLVVENEVGYRGAVFSKELAMREEKQLADEIRAQMMTSEDLEDEGDEEGEDEEDDDEDDEDDEDNEDDEENEEEDEDVDDGRNWTTVEHQMKEAAEYSENLEALSALVKEWRKSHDAGTD